MFTLIKAKARGYSEEGQDHDVKFAFANRKGDTITEMFSGVKCRDFLGDALFAEQTGKPVSIYNFVYDPQASKVDRDLLRLVVSTSKENSKYLNIIRENQAAVLWRTEKFHNLEPTNITVLDETNLLFEADKSWLLTTYLISYYTFVVKCASYTFKEPNNWRQELLKMDGKEARYLNHTDKVFDKLTQNLFTLYDPKFGVCGLPNDGRLGQVHHYTGFLSTSTISKDGTEYSRKFQSL